MSKMLLSHTQWGDKPEIAAVHEEFGSESGNEKGFSFCELARKIESIVKRNGRIHSINDTESGIQD